MHKIEAVTDGTSALTHNETSEMARGSVRAMKRTVLAPCRTQSLGVRKKKLNNPWDGHSPKQEEEW